MQKYEFKSRTNRQKVKLRVIPRKRGRMITYPLLNNFWSVGRVVKTSPFHGGSTGSIPVRTISINVRKLMDGPLLRTVRNVSSGVGDLVLMGKRREQRR